jgi:ribosomal-protein-serine acetyltransferase
MRSGISLSNDWPLSRDPVDAADILPIDLGDGLVLDLTTVADAAPAYDVVVAERGRLREWLPWVDATTDLAIEQEFLRGIERVNALGAGLNATIREHGEFCGFVGLRVDLTHRSAEIGYWLAERCTGRGVMIRCVAAMFDAGFTRLGLHRLELLAATGNTRSRAIAERLGMRFEGIRREAEELPIGFVDLAMYALLVQDWPGADAALERARTRPPLRDS